MAAPESPDVIVIYAVLYALVCVPALIYLWKKGMGNEALFWVFAAISFPFLTAVTRTDGVRPFADDFLRSPLGFWLSMSAMFSLVIKMWATRLTDSLGFVPWRALVMFASGYAVIFLGSAFTLDVRHDLRPAFENFLWFAPFALFFGAILVGYREYQNWRSSED